VNFDRVHDHEVDFFTTRITHDRLSMRYDVRKDTSVLSAGYEIRLS
jgi:hypothetical protein